jgi:hypothetical protein
MYLQLDPDWSTVYCRAEPRTPPPSVSTSPLPEQRPEAARSQDNLGEDMPRLNIYLPASTYALVIVQEMGWGGGGEKKVREW